jgi:transposase
MVMATRKSYSREFKLEAARLVVNRGYSIRQASERVGCNHWSLRDWIKKFQAEGALPSKDAPCAEAEEMKRLRKENANLRMENEILKKATAYFARESL